MKHESWDTIRLPKPRQGKYTGRGRVRTTGLPHATLSSAKDTRLAITPPFSAQLSCHPNEARELGYNQVAQA
ncbi:hypothetical protein T265_14700, partial [Opisthorchis viverrini]